MPVVRIEGVDEIESQTPKRFTVDSVVDTLATLPNDLSTLDAKIDTTKTDLQGKITTDIAQAVSDLVGGASGAYDTLKELETALADNDSDIAALVNSIAKKLDTTVNTGQTLVSTLTAPTFIGNLQGNADTATSATSATSATTAASAGKWTTGVAITLTGDVTSTAVTVDGSSPTISIPTTVTGSVGGGEGITKSVNADGDTEWTFTA